jgi:hypothetical protein
MFNMAISFRLNFWSDEGLKSTLVINLPRSSLAEYVPANIAIFIAAFLLSFYGFFTGFLLAFFTKFSSWCMVQI